MAPTTDDFRDLRWLLRILNRSSLEARYPQWREMREDTSRPHDDEGPIDGEEADEPRMTHVAAAAGDVA